eukprot:g4311.t1
MSSSKLEYLLKKFITIIQSVLDERFVLWTKEVFDNAFKRASSLDKLWGSTSENVRYALRKNLLEFALEVNKDLAFITPRVNDDSSQQPTCLFQILLLECIIDSNFLTIHTKLEDVLEWTLLSASYLDKQGQDCGLPPSIVRRLSQRIAQRIRTNSLHGRLLSNFKLTHSSSSLETGSSMKMSNTEIISNEEIEPLDPTPCGAVLSVHEREVISELKLFSQTGLQAIQILKTQDASPNDRTVHLQVVFEAIRKHSSLVDKDHTFIIRVLVCLFFYLDSQTVSIQLIESNDETRRKSLIDDIQGLQKLLITHICTGPLSPSLWRLDIGWAVHLATKMDGSNFAHYYIESLVDAIMFAAGLESQRENKHASPLCVSLQDIRDYFATLLKPYTCKSHLCKLIQNRIRLLKVDLEERHPLEAAVLHPIFVFD